GQVDYLINNAGYLFIGTMEECTPKETMTQFKTNVFGLLNTTKAFLPYFRNRRAGMIVNISSQGGSLNTPGVGIYCATKAAVDSLSDTLARELAEFNVKCISIQPGTFRTEVSAGNLRHVTHRVPEYTVTDKLIAGFSAAMGTQKGDPNKAAVRIFDFVTAEGRELPLQLALGDDAFEHVKAFHIQRLADMDKFKSWSVGTNFD
ncbi:hypothetical protein DFH08DRAFT_722901, partial [Mycena albidolilacea]